ncbi:MAG: NADH-quinone oxidoreductase subunit A [Candidatus Micrarchaeaceae archaeon]
MEFEYILALLFSCFSIAIPVVFIVFSKLIGNKSPVDEVEAEPYESSEETIGESRAIFSEYLPYFTLFIPFEIIALMLLLWSATAYSLSAYTNIMYFMLAVLATGVSIIAYKLASSR